jgi:hypothetical protein
VSGRFDSRTCPPRTAAVKIEGKPIAPITKANIDAAYADSPRCCRRDFGGTGRSDCRREGRCFILMSYGRIHFIYAERDTVMHPRVHPSTRIC